MTILSIFLLKTLKAYAPKGEIEVERMSAHSLARLLRSPVQRIAQILTTMLPRFLPFQFPDFHLVGSNMIDLRTVYRKHDAGRYAMTVELLDDLHQIVDTCKQYANASTAFDLWNPNEPMQRDLCSDTQRKEMENFPKMQTFIAKMERLFAAIRKERPME